MSSKKPQIIKNFREFKKSGQVTPPKPPVPAAPIPEIIKAAPVFKVDPQPSVSAIAGPVQPLNPLSDDEEVMRVLRDLEGGFIPSQPAAAIIAETPKLPNITPVDLSNIPGAHDGVVPGDPSKVIIAGKEYSVAAEPAKEPKPEVKEEILTANVVEAYVPADTNIATEVIVCIKPPKNFNKDTHPWLQDEALVMLQVVAVDIERRQSLFLSSLNEDLLYPLEFVYMKGGVLPVRRVTTYERICKDAFKTKEPEAERALEIFDAIVAKNTEDVAVEISLINTEKGPLYKVKFHQVLLDKSTAPNR